MNETFELNGFWWLPETPEIKIPGTLSYSPGDGPRLELMGAVNKTREEDFPPPDFINPDLIHGISSKGEPVTLFKCLQKSGYSNIGFAGSYHATEFLAHFAFFGTHFSTPADIQFTSLSVHFHNLDNWYNKSCIQNDTPEPGIGVITFKRPDPIRIHLKEFQVLFEVFESQNYKLNSASIDVEAWVIISEQSKKTIDDYLNLCRLIQYFLTLAITKPTFVTEMNGSVNEIIETADGKIPSQRIIKIYYAAIGWLPHAQAVSWANMLLPLSEVESSLPGLIRVWVEKSEIIKPVYDLYFAGFFRSTYPENEFINLTQAIETYHRRTYGGQYQTDEIFLKGLYEKLLAAIPDEIPDDFKNSLKKGKLRYANEYSLRKRIFLLSNHISSDLSINFLRDGKERSSFAEKIADTRNYLTHYSADLKDSAFISGERLFVFNQQLKLILMICLLEELGFPFEEIERLLRRNRNYQKYFESAIVSK